jgi:hypothetical protein
MRGPLHTLFATHPFTIHKAVQLCDTISTADLLDTLHLLMDEAPDIVPPRELYARPIPVHITDRDLRRAIKARIASLEDELIQLRASHAHLAALYARANLLPPTPDTLATYIKKELAYLKAHLTPQSDSLDIAKAKQVPIESLLPPSSPTRSLGTRLTTTCPFHLEKTPSFTIFTSDNHFHCYGCQAHGDAITFVQKLHNFTFKEAVNHLTSLA